MEQLSVPFEKGLITQLGGRNVGNLKGGFIKGSQTAWLSQNSHLYLVSTVDGSQLDLCTFASVPAADPAVEVSTEVTCVVELAPRVGRKTHQLVVGLNHNDRTGMVCVYDMRASKVVRAVHMPSPVASLSVIDHGLGSRESRQVLHHVLREMDGILAVGLSKGDVFIVDLRRSDYERATSYSRCRDEFDICYLLPVTTNNPRLGNEERLRRQEGDHLCVFINSMYLRETGMLVDKTGQTGCELISNDVCVSCMQYVPLVMGLIVGYDEGFFQLWNIRSLKLEYSSYVRDRRMGRVSHVVFQEPNDDPHPVCYVWSAHESASQHVAVLYSLTYDKWEYVASHGYLYKGFVSALELSMCDSALPPNVRARFVNCYCLERVKEAVRFQGQEEGDLSLAVFVWEQVKGGRVTTHAHLFDMNEWLKGHRRSEENRMQRSCVTFPVPAGALAVAVEAESLRHFVTLQRLDKHLSPFALSFYRVALLPCSVEKGWCEGAQKKLVTEILARGPTCLADSGLVQRCVKASLQPTIGCDEPPQTEVERKKFLLNLILEYCYSPDAFLGSSDNASDFRLLSLLHVWGWERAQALKDNIDHLSVRLFDVSGVRVDEMWHSELRHCGTQLLTLYILFSQLEKLAGESLSNVWEHKEGIMLMHVYYVVLQWFVAKGLLPESAGSSGIPYPVVEMKQWYMSRRTELAAEGRMLFIDQFLERECDEEDLLRLGLVNGVYPPHSVQCLVKMYLLSEIQLNVKNILTTYVFKDVVSYLSENRRRCAVQELKDFAFKLQLKDSVVRLAEALWLFDHEFFQEGVSVLVDHNVPPADVTPWLHTNIVNMLVSQHQFPAALAFMKWNKMASKSKDDARLFLTVCCAEKSFDTAFQFVHEFCREGTWSDVLQSFFTSCERAGLLKKVMHQPLSDYEEQEFLNYLRRSSSPDAEDMRVLYFTMRGRVSEGLAENDRINRERLHRPRRRRLLCDEVMPLRQLLANIYCKARLKDGRAEEDDRLLLVQPAMEKMTPDTTLQDKSRVCFVCDAFSTLGSVKRPRLSREVRSTLHSLYVSSPGFPHLPAAQCAASVPQGILKVRSYPSTRDTSVETLVTTQSSSIANEVLPASDTNTPTKRIQFRISSDSSEEMEVDEGVDELLEQTEDPPVITEHEHISSVKPPSVSSDKSNTDESENFAKELTDKDESDHELALNVSLRGSEVGEKVLEDVGVSSVLGYNTDNIEAANERECSSESANAEPVATETTVEQMSTSSQWPAIDIGRFNRSGIGPRRPLSSASREAASKIFISTVIKKTRTTEEFSTLVVEEEDVKNYSGRRRLDFDDSDSTELVGKAVDEQIGDSNKIGTEKVITIVVQNNQQRENSCTENEVGNVLALNNSEGSCVSDVLSINISDDTFGDDVSHKEDILHNASLEGEVLNDSTVSEVEESGIMNDSQVEDFTESETASQNQHKEQTSNGHDSSPLRDVCVTVQSSKHGKEGVCDMPQVPSFTLGGESSTPIHGITGAPQSSALMTSDINISLQADVVTPVFSNGKNKTLKGVSMSYIASQMETSCYTLNNELGDAQISSSKQHVPVEASMDSDTGNEDVGHSSLAESIVPVSGVVEESLVIANRIDDIKASDDGLSLTDPSAGNMSKTSTVFSNSADGFEGKGQTWDVTSYSGGVGTHLNKEPPDVPKKLTAEGQVAESVEINVPCCQKPVSSQIGRIPFGLSLELLSKKPSSDLKCETAAKVANSSVNSSEGKQIMCSSTSLDVSTDVTHSAATQEPGTEMFKVTDGSLMILVEQVDEGTTVSASVAEQEDTAHLSGNTDTPRILAEGIGHDNEKSVVDDTSLKQGTPDLSHKGSGSLVNLSVLQETEPMQMGDHSQSETSCAVGLGNSRASGSVNSSGLSEENTGSIKKTSKLKFVEKQAPVKKSESNTSSLVDSKAKVDERKNGKSENNDDKPFKIGSQGKNDVTSSVFVGSSEKEKLIITDRSLSKISGPSLPSNVIKEITNENFKTDVKSNISSEDRNDVCEALNILNSSMEIAVEGSDTNIQEQGAMAQETSVVCTDEMRVNVSEIKHGSDSSQVEYEQKVEETVVKTGKKENTTCDDLAVKIGQSDFQKVHTPVESIEESEVGDVQVVHKSDGINAKTGTRAAVSDLLLEQHRLDLTSSATQEMAVQQQESGDVSVSLPAGNEGSNITLVDSLPIISVQDVSSGEVQAGVVQSVADETCISSTVSTQVTNSESKELENYVSCKLLTPCEIAVGKECSVVPSDISDVSNLATNNENRIQNIDTTSQTIENSVSVSSEMLTQCLPTDEERKLVVPSIEQPESTDNENKSNKMDEKSLSEVLVPGLRSNEPKKDTSSVPKNIVASSQSLQTMSEAGGELAVSDNIGTELPVAESDEISSTLAVNDSRPDVVLQDRSKGLRSDSEQLKDTTSALTVPASDILELRSRSVERTFLDDTSLPRSISVKRQSPEPRAGPLKRHRSMSMLNLCLEVAQEASTPVRRQRRASVSCCKELEAPPPRRSLRLHAVTSGSEDEATLTHSSPARRSSASRVKKKGRVSSKQLQTVYEDMELTTDAARKKHGMESSDPDTGISNPFMMPRRFTRSQLRMMKQNIRLEDMHSLGNKSPSSASQVSAEGDASDEDDGCAPSVYGSEMSSMVSVSEDQSESGRGSPRLTRSRRRSYNLRSHMSVSPVSEVSHTQSTSSHDDVSSVVSGMSEFQHRDLEFGSPTKDDVQKSKQSHKKRSNRLSLPLPEELSSPTDSLHSQATEDERKSKVKELRRSPRRPKMGDFHDQTSTTSLSDAGPSPTAKDDDVSSTSSSDQQIISQHKLAKNKRDKRRQVKQVSSATNPLKKAKVSEEESAPAPRSVHSRQRYSRSAVSGRKSVRVRSSLQSSVKDKSA